MREAQQQLAQDQYRPLLADDLGSLRHRAELPVSRHCPPSDYHI